MKKNNKLIILLAIILIAVILFNVYILFYIQAQKTSLPSAKGIPDLDLTSYTKVNVSTDSNGFYLTGNCLSIFMPPIQAQTYAIEEGINNRINFRPLTQDIMKSIFDAYDIRVLMVKIVNFDGSTYYADLFLKQGNKIVNVDSRPSDAVAIAVRTYSPIYVRDDILKLGQSVC